MTDKLWGGRFTAKAAAWVDRFGASISFDQLMASEDLEGSLAHVKMLKKQEIIASADADQIIAGLKVLQDKLAKNELTFTIENEDIHLNMEKLLTEEIGPVAGKLHTARSRNDQVDTDLHLYVKHRLPKVLEAIRDVQTVLVEKASENVETLMPGYTHLQHAQPISYGHYLLAYFEMLQRDYERFEFNQKHTDILPLGAAALAGTTFPIDREYTAELLGFDNVYHNSLDAVSDRDFALEFLSNSALLMQHLSRMCEELVLWTSYEFGYLEMSDDFATGSSIMPQKKNSDFAELIRGKSGRVTGNLNSILMLMKSLPLAYNKDMQEDKEPVFDTYETIFGSLQIMAGMLSELTVHNDKMEHATNNDFSNETELADYLAAKGVPFREAHAIVGKLVLEGITTGKNLNDFFLAELKAANELIEDDVYEELKPEVAVARRTSLGGTAFSNVQKEVERAREIIKK